MHRSLGRKHGFESDRYAVPCHAPATPPPSFTEYRLRNENLFPSLTSFPLSSPPSLRLASVCQSSDEGDGNAGKRAREMKGRSFSSRNMLALSLARLSKESSIDHFLSIPFTCAINQLRINEPAGWLWAGYCCSQPFVPSPFSHSPSSSPSLSLPPHFPQYAISGRSTVHSQSDQVQRTRTSRGRALSPRNGICSISH